MQPLRFPEAGREGHRKRLIKTMEQYGASPVFPLQPGGCRFRLEDHGVFISLTPHPDCISEDYPRVNAPNQTPVSFASITSDMLHFPPAREKQVYNHCQHQARDLFHLAVPETYGHLVVRFDHSRTEDLIALLDGGRCSSTFFCDLTKGDRYSIHVKNPKIGFPMGFYSYHPEGSMMWHYVPVGFISSDGLDVLNIGCGEEITEMHAILLEKFERATGIKVDLEKLTKQALANGTSPSSSRIYVP